MSDFGELCPLFNTGVYNEVTFGPILSVSAVLATQNLLENKLGSAGTGADVFTFGRTVVVTDAWFQRYETNVEAENLILGHRLTQAALATAIASATVTTSLSVCSILTWQSLTPDASKTFTSNEVLSLAVGTLTAVTQGSYNLMVRFREK